MGQFLRQSSISEPFRALILGFFKKLKISVIRKKCFYALRVNNYYLLKYFSVSNKSGSDSITLKSFHHIQEPHTRVVSQKVHVWPFILGIKMGSLVVWCYLKLLFLIFKLVFQHLIKSSSPWCLCKLHSKFSKVLGN